MEKYSNYKDSSVDWIGDIPQYWDIKKVKFVGNVMPSNVDKKTVEGEQQIDLCNYVDVYKNDFITADMAFMTATASDSQIEKFSLKAGDVIATKDSEDPTDIAVPAFVPKDIQGVICGYHLTLMRPDANQLNGNFLFWLIKSTYYNQFFSTQANGITRYGIGTYSFKNVPIILPSINEQKHIAHYLNTKTAKIDKLISDKERLTELLNEECIAIINQAVTRGIDLNVPMKDSAIDWLGDVPRHWQVKRMKYLCDIGTGDKDTENREDDGAYPFYVRSQTIERISSYSFDGEAILTAGDGVGVCKVWHYVDGKFDYHQRVYRMSDFKEVSGKYLYYYLKYNFEKEVKKLSAKSTVDSLRRPMFQNFLVSFGSITEQASIVNYVEAEEKRIENIIDKTKQEIELLKEYKTSLISEVVTGKVDVRNEVIPETGYLTLAS
ncbi:restriction endonuclease subunit S [Mucilaginibacter rubeus]|uniref:Type I restriction modification DNA specificity domain-containing protein n=1 Tax=Mucilaginibacter rubeus TaxID=2027860 RepID=A0A5C1HWC2_9SPHI|nr:restriction endonuclease subunit S [Mucilaginibacter rubeus]QEM10192.1 hypothetical protein DEO27_009195 [Mucilaginibacter rubeus]